MKWTRKLLKPLIVLCNAVLNLRRYGLQGTIELYRTHVYETYRDWRMGVRTSGYIKSESLGHEVDHMDYESADYRWLDVAFENLKPDPEKDVFLDYGCGKGRAVVMAAMYPFRRVMGVELSADLCAVARQNVQSAAHTFACRDVQIVTGDATDYEIPSDVTVIYLFNPFTGNVLSAVQQRILESMERLPRWLRIVYVHPAKDIDAFGDCEWLTKLCELSNADSDEVKLKVYECCCVDDRSIDDPTAVVTVSGSL